MAGDYQLWMDDSGGPPGPPGRQPRWPRWIALVAGFAALLALIAVQHYAGGGDDNRTVPTPDPSVPPPATISHTSASSSPAAATSPIEASSSTRSAAPSRTSTVPVTTMTSGDLTLPGEKWELVGFQWSGALGGGSAVVRYRPDTGGLVTTPIPSLDSSGPFSFAVTADAAIVRPMDFVDGYVIPDGKPAGVATGPLLSIGGQPVLPSADPDLVWVPRVRDQDYSIELSDSTGNPTGLVITPPASLGIRSGWALTSDGAGAVLASAVGGVYDLRPHEVQLVTHGAVLAAGPTGYLVYECDESARCATAVVDRATGRRTALDSDVPTGPALAGQAHGTLSPNGRYAAIIDYSPDPRLVLVDLHSGKWNPVGDSLNGRAPVWGDASTVSVFTPDSGTLLMAAAGGVDAVDPATGEVLGRLPLPPLAAIALRPGG